ncbi:MAG: hypothetical protein ABIJ08_01695 [Nanoarchaeota archaeon]
MNKIKWCCSKKEGIMLIEPNENLTERYIDESNNTLENIGKIDGKWEVIMGYYACYNALYAIMMKCGIKSEIHDCTIALMKIIPQFTDNDHDYIINLKEDRISVQYYLKDKKLDSESKVKDFVLKCKHILDEIDVDAVREELNKYMGDKN